MSVAVRVFCDDHGAITAGKPLSARGVHKAGPVKKGLSARDALLFFASRDILQDITPTV
jgi:hypothetical protein